MKRHNLGWIDLEMTGLDVDNEEIIEIATIVTDQDLNIIDIGPDLVIKTKQIVLDNMDDWNTNQHTKSGLVDKVLKSNVTISQAEQITLDFLSKYLNPKESPLCGNTVSHDRKFLFKYMPTLESFFSYRHLDVTSIKLLNNYWYPSIKQSNKKESLHLALEDIKDSIAELKFYKDNIFK
jgi:oligoribonuclease